MSQLFMGWSKGSQSSWHEKRANGAVAVLRWNKWSVKQGVPVHCEADRLGMTGELHPASRADRGADLGWIPGAASRLHLLICKWANIRSPAMLLVSSPRFNLPVKHWQPCYREVTAHTAERISWLLSFDSCCFTVIRTAEADTHISRQKLTT